ncbi:MAG: hypothetical protein ABJE66_17645 [Deltaproteobacteria bacterium]
MADFRAFLAPNQPVVLPYFGGTRVDSAERRFRIEGVLESGWWRFRIEGRRAVAIEPSAPDSLDALARVRGHWIDNWIVVDSRSVIRVALPPDDEPAVFSRVATRRWYSGDHLFDSIEFEDAAEAGARDALAAERRLGDLRDVVPSLRVAFGIALGQRIAREAGVPLSVRELVPRAIQIAEHGRDGVRSWLAELEAERQRAAELARREAEQLRLATTAGTARAVPRSDDPIRRADEALDGAHARMITCRRLERGTRLDVTYDVAGTRIISMVDAETLQVLDPGICLSGAHGVLTLDAMPSVVREAIEEDHLNITRRA